MLRHEVILKVKKEWPDDDIEERLSQARHLADQIPLTRRAAAGRSASKDYRVAVLSITVDDETDLFRLQIHHSYATIVGLLQRMAEDLSVTDMVVDDVR